MNQSLLLHEASRDPFVSAIEQNVAPNMALRPTQNWNVFW